jgi:hypothetical protein
MKRIFNHGAILLMAAAIGAAVASSAAPEALAESAPAPSNAIPAGREIRRIEIARCTPGSPSLSQHELRQIMDRARPLVLANPASDPWQYAPWCAGSFLTPRGTYQFILFLGGRGDLTLPGGSRIRFEFRP